MTLLINKLNPITLEDLLFCKHKDFLYGGVKARYFMLNFNCNLNDSHFPVVYMIYMIYE